MVDLFFTITFIFFKKNQKQNNRHCVTCFVISIAYTLIALLSTNQRPRIRTVIVKHTSESENSKFPFFFTKNSLPWGVKCETQIKLHKIVGNLLDELRKLYMNRTVIEKFLAAVE